MKKIFKFSILAAIFAIAFLGCKKEDSSHDMPTGNMQAITLKGVVNDANGNPLSGVTVITGNQSATTGGDGAFSFKQAEVIDKRAIIRLEKSGYFSVTRSYYKQDEMYFQVFLMPKGNVAGVSLQTTFNASEGATLAVGGMKAVLPPSALKTADGSDYTGVVTANMLYLDPTKEKFSFMMPGGDNMGKNKNGGDVFLLSCGICKLELTDNAGNLLQIKGGTATTITYPIPEGATGNRPATIPISSFDKQKGVWVETRVATLKGDVYVDDLSTITKNAKEDLAPLVGVEDLAPLVPQPDPPVIVVGGVWDCNNKLVPHAEMEYTYWDDSSTDLAPMIPKTQIATRVGESGVSKATIPKGMNVKVSTNTNGGYDEKILIAEGDGDNMQRVSLDVPCDNGVGRAKEGAIKIKQLKGGNTSMLQEFHTWSNSGMLIRSDEIWVDESAPDKHKYEVRMYDHNIEKYSEGKKNWYTNVSEPEQPYWDIKWDEKFFACPTDHSPLQLIGGWTWDEQYWEKYRQDYTMTIAGKICKVYELRSYWKAASWEGILMYLEDQGEVTHEVLEATTNVPSSAFGQHFNITWLRVD